MIYFLTQRFFPRSTSHSSHPSNPNTFPLKIYHPPPPLSLIIIIFLNFCDIFCHHSFKGMSLEHSRSSTPYLHTLSRKLSRILHTHNTKPKLTPSSQTDFFCKKRMISKLLIASAVMALATASCPNDCSQRKYSLFRIHAHISSLHLKFILHIFKYMY